MRRALMGAFVLTCLLAGCSGGLTSLARPGAGQLRMIDLDGQSHAVRLVPALPGQGAQTRLVADGPEAAMRIFSQLCDGRAFSAADWPEGRLLRDRATGEWAIAGDCPHLPLS